MVAIVCYQNIVTWSEFLTRMDIWKDILLLKNRLSNKYFLIWIDCMLWF